MERTPNTFDAHRLIRLAGERGVQDAVVEVLFRAYFTDSDDSAATVRAEEGEARRLGVEGVPFFVLNGELNLTGAREPEPETATRLARTF